MIPSDISSDIGVFLLSYIIGTALGYMSMELYKKFRHNKGEKK